MTAMRRVVQAAATLAILTLCGAVAHADLPPGHVDQKEVCLECHDLEEALALPVAHAPVADGDCAACHNPHASRFDALLREHPATLCVSCHANLESARGLAVVHQPVAQGRCADCHQPHGSANQHLLVRTGKALCVECHSQIEDWEKRPIQHSPFAKARCADCHDPHASDNAALAPKPGGQTCAKCHPVTAAFQRSHGGYPVEQASCQQCHDPHASSRAGLMRETLHFPFAEGDCSACHAASSSTTPFALRAREATLCGDCHEEQVEASRHAPFPHVSAGGGSCTACHNPHAADGSSLLNGNGQSVCLECHDPAGSSSGEHGRYVTHEELDCTTCHDPHGGERPLLLQEESVALCATCHTHEHGIRHPLGEDVRDPRTGNPMTCLSCHGIHDGPYKFYLYASEEGEICVGCHKQIGGGS